MRENPGYLAILRALQAAWKLHRPIRWADMKNAMLTSDDSDDDLCCQACTDLDGCDVLAPCDTAKAIMTALDWDDDPAILSIRLHDMVSWAEHDIERQTCPACGEAVNR